MKNLWQTRSRFWVLFFIIFIASFSLALAEDESEPGDIPGSTIDRGKNPRGRNAPQHQHPSSSLSSSHSRRRRQAFDGFRFSDLFRIFNSGALEGVDSMLRSTRNIDVFRCLERLSCEMAAPLRNDGISSVEQSEDVAEAAVEQPSLLDAQQQLLQAAFPQTSQIVQPGLQQIQGLAQPSLQYFPQPFIPQIPQYAFPHYVHPAGGLIHPAASFIQPQYVPYPQALLHPSLQQLSIQGNHAAQTSDPSHGIDTHAMPAAAHGAAPTMVQPAGGALERKGENTREDLEGSERAATEDDYQTPWQWVSNRQFFQGYRDRIQRRQDKRNWFGRRLRNVWNEYYRRNGRNRRVKRDASSSAKKKESRRRLKRGIVDAVKEMWRGNDVLGALDRMMEGTDDSLYPYTKAALMGYTGTHQTCEKLYSMCPNSIDEIINRFNNLNEYFPNGMPFRDRIPRPFRYLVP